MHPLHDLPLDELTPARLWATLDRPTRALAARALFDGDLPTRDQANYAIALALRFRDAGVRKLSVDRRVDYLAGVVRPDHALASSLLIALHLGCCQKLIVSFLDELQIPNQDGLIAEDHKLGPVAAAALEPAVRRLRDQFDGAEVEICLASLLALDPEVAHAAAAARFGARIRPHGTEWLGLMRDAGFEPRTRIPDTELPHDTLAATRRRVFWQHRCPICEASRIAGRPVRGWRCAKCLASGLGGQLDIRRGDTASGSDAPVETPR